MSPWHCPQVDGMFARATVLAGSLAGSIVCAGWQVLQFGASALPSIISARPWTLLRYASIGAFAVMSYFWTISGLAWQRAQVATIRSGWAFDAGFDGEVIPWVPWQSEQVGASSDSLRRGLAVDARVVCRFRVAVANAAVDLSERTRVGVRIEVDVAIDAIEGGMHGTSELGRRNIKGDRLSPFAFLHHGRIGVTFQALVVGDGEGRRAEHDEHHDREEDASDHESLPNVYCPSGNRALRTSGFSSSTASRLWHVEQSWEIVFPSLETCSSS